MVESLFLSFNYYFLSYLQNKRNIDVSNITLRFVDTLGKSTNWTQHSSLSGFANDFQGQFIILPDSDFDNFFNNFNNPNSIVYQNSITKFNLICSKGPYSYIENVTLNNNNLSFDNSFQATNIFTNYTLNNLIKYDVDRLNFYQQEIERYKIFLNDTFNLYKQQYFQLKSYRDGLYVETCYVDIDYVD